MFATFRRFWVAINKGKMSAESRALFDALLMLFEVLMAVFMEKHTPKSSANSSLPASQSPNASAVPKVRVNGRSEDVIFFDGVFFESSLKSIFFAS